MLPQHPNLPDTADHALRRQALTDPLLLAASLQLLVPSRRLTAVTEVPQRQRHTHAKPDSGNRLRITHEPAHRSRQLPAHRHRRRQPPHRERLRLRHRQLRNLRDRDLELREPGLRLTHHISPVQSTDAIPVHVRDRRRHHRRRRRPQRQIPVRLRHVLALTCLAHIPARHRLRKRLRLQPLLPGIVERAHRTRTDRGNTQRVRHLRRRLLLTRDPLHRTRPANTLDLARRPSRLRGAQRQRRRPQATAHNRQVTTDPLAALQPVVLGVRQLLRHIVDRPARTIHHIPLERRLARTLRAQHLVTAIRHHRDAHDFRARRRRLRAELPQMPAREFPAHRSPHRALHAPLRPVTSHQRIGARTSSHQRAASHEVLHCVLALLAHACTARFWAISSNQSSRSEPAATASDNPI